MRRVAVVCKTTEPLVIVAERPIAASAGPMKKFMQNGITISVSIFAMSALPADFKPEQ